MKKLLLCMFLALTIYAIAQTSTTVSPSRIQWPLTTGSGAPGSSCTSVNYGAPYRDKTNHISYVCDPSGWVTVTPSATDLVTSIGSTPVQKAITATNVSGGTANVSSAYVGSPSAAAQAALPAGTFGYSCDETSTPGVPAAGVDYMRCDLATHGPVYSCNGSAESATPCGILSMVPTVGLVAASAPTFSPVAGNYTATQSVVVSCAKGAPYCSTDGVNLLSTCTSGVTVTSSTTIKAACSALGYNSGFANAVYTINASSAPVYVQSCGSVQYSGTTFPCTFGSNAATGNLLIGAVYFTTSATTLTSVTGTGGCTGTATLYNNATAILNSSYNMAEFTLPTTSAAVCTVTANFSGSTGDSGIVIAEVHGQASSSPVDQTPAPLNQAAGYATYNAANSIASTSVTDAYANDLAVGFVIFPQSPTYVAGTSPGTFTIRTTGNKMMLETAAFTSTTAQVTASQSSANSAYAAAGMITVHP